MDISKEDLAWAVAQGVLVSTEQADTLWTALENRHPERARFDLANMLYYFGALIVISAMGWFMTLGWESFGGLGISFIAGLYALCFVLAGRTLWQKEHLIIPGGLLITMAVGMAPLSIYGIQRWLGIWSEGDPGIYRGVHEWVKGSWFFMELGTILAGVLALKYFRFPFLTAPIAFCLWYMSMDVTPLWFGQTAFTWNERLWVSLGFGLVMLCIAFILDRRTEEDFAFWIYLFGAMAFWGGLTLMEDGTELGRFIYCLINAGLMVVSVLLDRRVFIVFGALGVFGYLSYLAYDVFHDAILFPFALTLLGVALIYSGIQYQKRRVAIEQALLQWVPPALRRMLPRERVVLQP